MDEGNGTWVMGKEGREVGMEKETLASLPGKFVVSSSSQTLGASHPISGF